MPAIVVTIVRVLLGLIFFVFGLNGFLNFIEVPPMPENIQAFMNGVMVAPYFMPLVKGTEVVCGFLFLINKKVALALVVIAPVCIQIFLFHAFLTPGIGNLIMPILILTLGTLLAWDRRAQFEPILFGR
ncbi:MAG: DoxX family membrane protein [Proteobacteria bacterium]|nr:DoxX family membrane protein [Pseudomonadota bacterium]